MGPKLSGGIEGDAERIPVAQGPDLRRDPAPIREGVIRRDRAGLGQPDDLAKI